MGLGALAVVLLSLLAGCGASSRSGSLAMGHFYNGHYSADALSSQTRPAEGLHASLADQLARMATASELWTTRKNPFMSKLPSMSDMAVEPVSQDETLPLPDQGMDPDSADEAELMPETGTSEDTGPPSAPAGGDAQPPQPAAALAPQTLQVVGIVYHPETPMAILATHDGRSHTVQRGDIVGSGRYSQRVAAIHKNWVDLVDVGGAQRHRRVNLQTASGNGSDGPDRLQGGEITTD